MRALLSLTSILTLAAGAALLGADWPTWRGPSNNGVSTETGLPVTWGAKCLDEPAATPAPPSDSAAATASAAQRQQGQRGRGRRGGREGRPFAPFNCNKLDTENVAWKVPLPAYSGSTPIIWGDTIFLNVATAPNTGELELWAIDRRTKQDYGKFGLNWGYASSPLHKGNALYVQVLHGMKTDDPSYILKIDALTGKTIWRVERPTEAVMESPDSCTTPAWAEVTGRPELIITGGDVVSGHDPATGAEYWRADVLNGCHREVLGGAYPLNRVAQAPRGARYVAAHRPRRAFSERWGGGHGLARCHGACATMCYMVRRQRESASIGVRELRQNLSVYLDRVKKGEALTVTERGTAVAILRPLPPDSSVLDRLVAAGRVAAPTRPLSRLPRPLDVTLERPLADVLDDLRRERL